MDDYYDYELEYYKAYKSLNDFCVCGYRKKEHTPVGACPQGRGYSTNAHCGFYKKSETFND